MKHGINACMKSEQQRWQLAVGLLGGWSMLLLASTAMLYGWIMLLYVLVSPLHVYTSAEAHVETAGTSACAAFLGAILASIIVLRQRREHTLLRLSPNVTPLIAAINRRLALVAVLCLMPTIALRALVTMKHPDSLDAVISLADVPIQGFWWPVLTLAYLTAVVVITFGWLRAPIRFAFLPIYWGAMPWSGSRWQWLPLVACVIIVIGHRLWLRTDMAGVVRVQTAERRAQLNVMERLNSWRLQRAARTMGDHRSSERVTALLGTRRSTLFTLVTVLVTAAYIAFAPTVFDVFVGGWFFAYLVVALLATPTPIPLGPVMLLPLGAERRNVGRILMSVWVRDVRFRLVLGVVLGLLLRTFCWWLDVYSFMRPPFAANSDEMMLLAWKPLMNAVGLFGAAYALCWTISASPRLLARPDVLAVLPMFAVTGFMAFGAGFGWVLGQAVPVLNSRDMSAVRFLIVNGVVFPAIAWAVNRQLRPDWLQANLGAISTAMQAWAARRQKSQPVL